MKMIPGTYLGSPDNQSSWQMYTQSPPFPYHPMTSSPWADFLGGEDTGCECY